MNKKLLTFAVLCAAATPLHAAITGIDRDLNWKEDFLVPSMPAAQGFGTICKQWVTDNPWKAIAAVGLAATAGYYYWSRPKKPYFTNTYVRNLLLESVQHNNYYLNDVEFDVPAQLELLFPTYLYSPENQQTKNTITTDPEMHAEAGSFLNNLYAAAAVNFPSENSNDMLERIKKIAPVYNIQLTHEDPSLPYEQALMTALKMQDINLIEQAFATIFVPFAKKIGGWGPKDFSSGLNTREHLLNKCYARSLALDRPDVQAYIESVARSFTQEINLNQALIYGLQQCSSPLIFRNTLARMYTTMHNNPNETFSNLLAQARYLVTKAQTSSSFLKMDEHEQACSATEKAAHEKALRTISGFINAYTINDQSVIGAIKKLLTSKDYDALKLIRKHVDKMRRARSKSMFNKQQRTLNELVAIARIAIAPHAKPSFKKRLDNLATNVSDSSVIAALDTEIASLQPLESRAASSSNAASSSSQGGDNDE